MSDDQANGHIWIKNERFGEHEFCKLCLIIKRADGQNKPCNGLVKVSPLETDHQGILCKGKKS